MHGTNPWARAGLVALLLVVGTAGECPSIGAPASKYPPKPVAGNWTGELYGVRFKLRLTESGTPFAYFNSTTVGGSGWLVYGTAPAESVAVALQGLNNGGPDYGVVMELQHPDGSSRSYGGYSGLLQADGTLLGPLERRASREPTPSPWTTRWPAEATTGSLRLTRQ